MRRRELIVWTALAMASLTAPAFAWTVYSRNGDDVMIKCSDSSMAAVQGNDKDGWTATAAGTNGRAGGHFAIMGQAAVYACGE